jgi:hypothetical protein
MDAFRTELMHLLRGGQAFEPFSEVIASFSPSERGVQPDDDQRSAWQILDHMRLAQRDILDFCQNENGTYCSRVWPDEYWSFNPTPTEGEWDRAIAEYMAGIDEFERLLSDPTRDVLVPFPWAEGQNLFREVLVAAEHAAYHIGQLVELKRWISSDTSPHG